MIFKPFCGLRPRPDLSARIPSVPYDVVDSAEARELAGEDPYSFLHVIKPEIDLDRQADPYSDAVYEQGRRNLLAMIENGWLVQDDRPSFYVYRLTMERHVQIGLMGLSAVGDYREGRIKKHELTRPEKEKDRIRVIETLSAIPGPVFLTYNGLPEINALVNAIVSRGPQVDFRAADDVRHELWPVGDVSFCEKIESLFRSVPNGYVADGHHRAAAAAKAGCSDFFLTVYFPADQLQVLDYNRFVADLNGLAPEVFVRRIEEAGFDLVRGYRARRPQHRRCFGMYLEGEWYQLTAQPRLVPAGGAVRRLDVSILMEHLLGPILGIGDPRTDKRIDFIGGARGMQELERRVDSAGSGVSFALFPVSVDEIIEIADAGEIMPPKTTWFEPKLRSGMVVQLTGGEAL